MSVGAGDPDDSIVLAHVVVDPRGIVIPNGESNEVGRSWVKQGFGWLSTHEQDKQLYRCLKQAKASQHSTEPGS
jgi:hypothetical protein